MIWMVHFLHQFCDMLRIAIQKSGRLNEDSTALLRESGIKFAGSDRKLFAPADNFPIEILYLRDDDIPEYVHDGVADLGIVGENVYHEVAKPSTLVKKLGFGKCRLSIAIPKDVEYTPSYLSQARIATSYPNILTKYLNDKGVSHLDIQLLSGSVEIAPNIGLSDAICDLVSSGSTLIQNGLKEVEVIMKSEAVLIANNKVATMPEKQSIVDQLIFRIESVQKGKDYKYIILNIENSKIGAIQSILPGMKSPTITPLHEPGWSSMHSVVKEDQFWEVIGQLKSLGAQGILVVPIEKMIF